MRPTVFAGPVLGSYGPRLPYKQAVRQGATLCSARSSDVVVLHMTARAHAVLQEALSLPDDDHADIAAELLASLDEAVDDPETVQTLWAKNSRHVPSASYRASWEEDGGPFAGAVKMN